MYEYPPILKGTEQQQIAALRDYLVRLVREMERRDAQEVSNNGS